VGGGRVKTLDLSFMRPPELQATQPPEARGLARDEVRLLVSVGDRHEHARFRDLPRFLTPGTLLVVNRSATLPASLRVTSRIGPWLLNLSTRYGDALWLAEPRWNAAEPGPLPLTPGETLTSAHLVGRLIAPYPGLPRLWFVCFEADIVRAMNRLGEPIRYGYLRPPYPPLAAYQTAFARVPGSAEMPSAARPFTPRVIQALRQKGVQFATIVLHTGVSSIEIEETRLEHHVLYPEPFEVPAATASAVQVAREQGRPVIAVGTTVVRALESAWFADRIRSVAGFTRRFVRPGAGVKVVDGLITGFHEPRANHLALLSAIARPETIRSAYAEAVRERYLWHEFGDSHLLLPAARRSPGVMAGGLSPARQEMS
jgi:S-adenosylmethionine:tRNA ribosyltransferase-isomerase